MKEESKPVDEEELKVFTKKLEEFSVGLEPNEKGILKEMIANMHFGAPGDDEGADGYALRDFRQAAFAALRPLLSGATTLNADDGFWARWAKRQY